VFRQKTYAKYRVTSYYDLMHPQEWGVPHVQDFETDLLHQTLPQEAKGDPLANQYRLHVVTPHEAVDEDSLSKEDRRKLDQLNQKLLQAPLSQKKAVRDERAAFLDKIAKKLNG
jgi:hypothetical protein